MTNVWIFIISFNFATQIGYIRSQINVLIVKLFPGIHMSGMAGRNARASFLKTFQYLHVSRKY